MICDLQYLQYQKNNLNTIEMSRIYDKDGNEIAKLGSEKREIARELELKVDPEDTICRTAAFS